MTDFSGGRTEADPEAPPCGFTTGGLAGGGFTPADPAGLTLADPDEAGGFTEAEPDEAGGFTEAVPD
ncbi:MAG: hypothetical protein ABW046_20415, partial [Actinoplanes sp.]